MLTFYEIKSLFLEQISKKDSKIEQISRLSKKPIIDCASEESCASD